MAKKNNATDQLFQKVAKLTKEGYVSLPKCKTMGDNATNPNDNVLNNLMSTDDSVRMSDKMFCGSENPVPVSNKGTKDLGYIGWGASNALPNNIATLVALLPYTASGIKFNVDTVASVGPKLKYKIIRYVNGTVKKELIDYDTAGEYLRGRILDKMALLDTSTQSADDFTTVMPNVASTPKTISQKRKNFIEADLKLLEAQYDTWKKTSDEVKVFLENNDLNLTFLKFFEDDAYMDIAFPQFELSQGSPREAWEPKITGIRHRSVLTCRLEQMDANGVINYVYVSNQWRKRGTNSLTDTDVTAIPALHPESAIKDLKAIARKNVNSGLRSRPTRFILPTYYPSIDHPYYPHPAFWSIFSSKMFNYASTLMSDKAIARANGNMWGKIVYIHNDYLKQLYASAEATSEEDKDKVLDSVWGEINTFLKDKQNNGKTLLSYVFNGSDNKEHKAFEIVDVPQSASGSATKDELEEIANILFFALEIHPSLIGAVPGKGSNSGGTDKRELFLLKQLRMTPRRLRYLRLMEVIHQFNGWDENAEWVIPDQVLTTLDANKTGMTEKINN